MELKEKAFHGVRWNTIATGVIASGSIIQIFILVRFIEKSDFGLMAMINVVIAFTSTFLDFGISSGVIHKQNISDGQLSTLYFFALIMGFSFTIMLFVLSPAVAIFYREPALEYLLRILSVLFVIQSIGLQFNVLLTKGLQFELLAKINMLVFVVSFLVTVSLAISGFGVLSLVIGRLIYALLESTLLVFFGRHTFSLKWCMNMRDIQYFLRFGSYQMGERLFNFFNRQIDVILIGKLLGAESLGVYDIIKRLLKRPLQLINPIINDVSFPLMSSVQDDAKKVGDFYLKQLNYICTFNFAIYLFLFFNAEQVLHFLFGLDWGEYKWVFMIMSLYFLIYASGNPVGTLLLARGRPELGFYWNAVTVILISSFVYLGIRGGLEGVAVALLFMQCLLIIPNYVFLVNKAVPIEFKTYLFKLGQPFLIALIVGATTFICSKGLHFTPLVNLLFLGGVAMGVFFVLNFLFNRSFIWDMRLLLKI